MTVYTPDQMVSATMSAASCQTAGRSASWKNKALEIATRIKSTRRQSVIDVESSIFRVGSFAYDDDTSSLIMQKGSFEGHQDDEFAWFDQRTVVMRLSSRQELAAATAPLHDLC
jgi:hypothetical protein